MPTKCMEKKYIINYLDDNKINYIAGKLNVSDGKKQFIPYNNNNNYNIILL